VVALIPARAGSKRVPGKNTRLLGGVPLITWTIRAAQESGIFERIVVSSDDQVAWDAATACGVRINIRKPEHAADHAADILWVREELSVSREWHSFAILRPTSPFRAADTIRRAYKQFTTSEVHSIRAVEPVRQHPGKMWWWGGVGTCLTPVCDAKRSDGTPWHSCPTQTLPTAYVQNASLEMAWTYVVQSFGTISGRKIAPFFTKDYEGFDINTEDDWREAERLVRDGCVALPRLPAATQS